jgi:peptide-methionine (S)-S-oxide reductase
MAMNALKYSTLTVVAFVALSFGVSITKAYMKDAPELPDAATGIKDERGTQTAVFAGGCFWCTEVVFEQIKGVNEVVSGYAGGSKESAKYDLVSGGGTQHAESIQIKYDPSQITYAQLLKIFFSVAHDPTQLNRQGPDFGAQYRSAIFYVNDEQKRVAEAYVQQLTEAKSFNKPIVTKIGPLPAFYPAEQYHQDFVKRNPNHPYVIVNARPKLKKLQDHFSALLKSSKS